MGELSIELKTYKKKVTGLKSKISQIKSSRNILCATSRTVQTDMSGVSNGWCNLHNAGCIMQVAGCIIQVAGCHLWPWAVWPQQRAASSMTLKSWSLISSSVIMGGHIKTIVSYKRYCRGISRSISMHYMQMI